MLKYLFTALYNDGTVLKQQPDDTSTKDPLKSAYYDIDHEKLFQFAIDDEENAVMVDLSDGSFELNGVKFQLYDKPVNNRRLIYFRRHTHNFNVQGDPLDHSIAYGIGWQGNDPDTNENIQRIIYID